MSIDTSGNVAVQGLTTAKDFVMTDGTSLDLIKKFNVFSASSNGICNDALYVHPSQFNDANKPQIVSIQNTSNLPDGIRFGVRLVFVLDANNFIVVLIGRGIAGAKEGLNIWMNQYTVGGTWTGWKALS